MSIQLFLYRQFIPELDKCPLNGHVFLLNEQIIPLKRAHNTIEEQSKCFYPFRRHKCLVHLGKKHVHLGATIFYFEDNLYIQEELVIVLEVNCIFRRRFCPFWRCIFHFGGDNIFLLYINIYVEVRLTDNAYWFPHKTQTTTESHVFGAASS